MTLNFEKEKLISELKERKPKKVLVQLAEGIKQNAPEISEWIEQSLPGVECIFQGKHAGERALWLFRRLRLSALT